jgi:hypothetical protein
VTFEEVELSEEVMPMGQNESVMQNLDEITTTHMQETPLNQT